MLRRSLKFLIDDFSEKGKFKPWREYHVPGKMKLPYKDRSNGTIHRTTPENSLVNHPAFQHLVKEIDPDFLAEKQIKIEDLRWLDERLIRWKCLSCGSKRLLRPRDRTKNGVNCKVCETLTPSAVDPQIRSTATVAQLQSGELKRSLAEYQDHDAASRRVVKIQCSGCSREFSRSIRSLTGVSAPGMTAIPKQDVCDHCLWGKTVMQYKA
eukprot:PhF_6_TR33825/c0_g1_i1/m.49607